MRTHTFPKKHFYKNVLLALRHWGTPTRKGMDFFMELKLAEDYGIRPELALVDCRVAINTLLAHYIHQLGRLQPEMRDLLVWRFALRRSVLQIAYDLGVSADHTARVQRTAVSYLAELIYDDERLKS